MKIVLFTQDDPFYTKTFFDEFFKHYDEMNEIQAVVISKAMGKTSLFSLCRQMYDFYGPFDFIYIGIKYVLYKVMARRKISRNPQNPRPKTYSIKQLADYYGVRVIERSDLNSSTFIEMIKMFGADLFISIASPVIFKEELIGTPKLDCINIHNAPLPKYRGMLPNFWQLYHDEQEAGMTVHRIEKGIDTGDIIKQAFLPIGPDDTLNNLILKTKKKNAWLIMEVIDDFQNGNVKYKKMKGKGSYFSFPSPKHLRIFKKKGKKIR